MAATGTKELPSYLGNTLVPKLAVGYVTIGEDGNPVYRRNGQQTAAQSQSVTPASDGAPFRMVVANQGSTAFATVRAPGDGAPAVTERGMSVVTLGSYLFHDATASLNLARGDGAGAYVKQMPTDGINRSITANTASQLLMPANASRTRFIIKNDSTVDVWINIGASAGTTAGSGNMRISAGGFFELTGTRGAINIAATAAAPITAYEF